jgi:hypothetical protein
VMLEGSVNASAPGMCVLTLGKARTWYPPYGSPAGVSIAAPMTAMGHELTWRNACVMSALPPRATKQQTSDEVASVAEID